MDEAALEAVGAAAAKVGTVTAGGGPSMEAMETNLPSHDFSTTPEE